MTKISRDEYEYLTKLKTMRDNFKVFCTSCLKIITKKRKKVTFRWNKAQKYVHGKLEEQREKTGGRVRALILKGRQQGMSTYVAARFYHRATLYEFITVYILSHLDSSAKTLFEIVARYHKTNPIPPRVGKRNTSEMDFPEMESSYTVATAGEGEGGRSKTATLFHGSEVAFWRNADSHFAASVQTIPYEPGTEIILESTARGPQGKFYELWQEAIAGKGDYIAIFVPWFWQDEYERDIPEDFELMDDGDDDTLSEIEYYDTFKDDGLSMRNMVWRRAKIAEVGRTLFDQEYPATAALAFTEASTRNYLPAKAILHARKRTRQGVGPLIFGVDPAGEGGDRFAITARRGLKVEWVVWRDNLNHLEAYQWLRELILEHEPARVNIDAGNIGAAVITLLKNDGDIEKKLIKAVNFGSPSQFKQGWKNAGSSNKGVEIPPGPINRRAEMYQRLKDWLSLEEGVDIPDLEIIQSDLTTTHIKPTLNNDLQLESKHDIRARGVRSPDIADSMALTFAFLTRITDYKEKDKKMSEIVSGKIKRKPRSGGKYGWMA